MDSYPGHESRTHATVATLLSSHCQSRTDMGNPVRRIAGDDGHRFRPRAASASVVVTERSLCSAVPARLSNRHHASIICPPQVKAVNMGGWAPTLRHIAYSGCFRPRRTRERALVETSNRTRVSPFLQDPFKIVHKAASPTGARTPTWELVPPTEVGAGRIRPSRPAGLQRRESRW